MNIKAAVSKKKRLRGSVSMWVVIVLCFIALLLMVYNVLMSNYWYVAGYLIAVILGGSYVLVTLNELYSTWIMTDGESLVLRCWDNCFFPYQTLYSVKFFGELIPAKNVRLRVPVADITQVFIGTKMFIKRNTNDEAFLQAVALYEKTKFNSNQRILEKSDIFYVNTVTNDSVFMNITNFDSQKVIKILKAIASKNPSVEIKASGRAYRRFKSGDDQE